MNTGLQDAANLAWKLASVLRGANDALLESYDSERRPVGEAVVKSTGKLFAAAAGQSGFKAAMRDRMVSLLLPIITKLPPFQKKAFFNASQRAIAYPSGTFIAAGSGKRAADAPLAGGQTLFARIAGYRFHTLVLSRTPLTSVETERLAGLPDAIVVDGEQPEAGAVFDRYGVPAGGQSTLLIRPDGYVAWRADSIALDACAEFQAQFSPYTEVRNVAAA